MRWKCTCAYDGTEFAGWQIQARGEVTVQGTLEKRIAGIFKQPIRIHGSGRTDSGVHAEGQVFHFDADWKHSTPQLLAALHMGLPAGLQILSLELVPDTFHARYSATGKHYAYYLNEEHASVFETRYYWSIGKQALNIKAMQLAAKHLLGTHDFSAFGASRGNGAEEKENPVKEMRRLDITRLEGTRIRIDTEASGYLYKMVRSLVGTLVEVGLGKLSADEIPLILTSKQRTYKVPTAPAQGLRLVKVYY